MQEVFGAGALWAVPSGSNPLPVNFGVLQENTIDFTANTKALYGGSRFPVTVAQGTMSITGKGKNGQFKGSLFNLLLGGSSVTGQTIAIENETGTVPGTSTYTVTVTNSATWVLDLGVKYASTGVALTRVSSVSAVGTYSVAAGVYTFHSSDASAAVLVSYTYTTTGGQTITMNNAPTGTATTFKSVTLMRYNSQNATFTLNACVAKKLSLATKIEDFTLPEFDYEAFADTSNVLGTFSVAELN